MGSTWRRALSKHALGKRKPILIIVRASFSGQDWIERGYQVWRKSAPAGYMENDFFLFNTNGVWVYSAFVNNLRTFARLAVTSANIDTSFEILHVDGLTAHSLRCTIAWSMTARPRRSSCSKATGMTQRWSPNTLVTGHLCLLGLFVTLCGMFALAGGRPTLTETGRSVPARVTRRKDDCEHDHDWHLKHVSIMTVFVEVTSSPFA